MRPAWVMKTQSPPLPPLWPPHPTIPKLIQVRCQTQWHMPKISEYEDMNSKSCAVWGPAKATKPCLKIQQKRKERLKNPMIK